MDAPTLTCQNDQQRRREVRETKERYSGKDETRVLNGMDYLEVSEDQRTLTVYLLQKASTTLKQKLNLTNKNATKHVRIEGGRRIFGRDLVIKNAAIVSGDANKDDRLVIEVEEPGDFSIYTLRLGELDANNQPADEPMNGIDPRYARLKFSFRENCASDLDCKTPKVCPPPARVAPEINYLAKDYAGFRQLILDRLSQIMPGWKERHVPDLGVTLVEMLAYAGDYLSYYQDAVATEAYLDTARRRISVRRHARLVDYPMHEGCNARTWVHVETSDDLALDSTEIYFITRHDDIAESGRVLREDELRHLPAARYEVFELWSKILKHETLP